MIQVNPSVRDTICLVGDTFFPPPCDQISINENFFFFWSHLPLKRSFLHCSACCLSNRSILWLLGWCFRALVFFFCCQQHHSNSKEEKKQNRPFFPRVWSRKSSLWSQSWPFCSASWRDSVLQGSWCERWSSWQNASIHQTKHRTPAKSSCRSSRRSDHEEHAQTSCMTRFRAFQTPSQTLVEWMSCQNAREKWLPLTQSRSR